MALQFEVDTLDGIDDSIKALYAEADGKFRLAVEGIDPADELKEALRKEREERKNASKRASDLEQAQRTAEETRLKEKDEFKTLYEREQASRKELEEKYGTFKQQIEAKDIDAAALKIASQLTRDTKRADLLQKEARGFAKYGENGIYFEIGGVEVDNAKVLEHLSKEYPFLIDGNQASGGGAAGSSNGVTGSKIISRAEFDKLSDGAKTNFMRDGGKLSDN